MAIRVFSFRGSPYEVGLEHGQALKEEIRAFLAFRMAGCRRAVQEAGAEIRDEEILALAAEHGAPIRQFTPELFEELEGLGEGAGLSIEQLIVLNGYTDFKDTLVRAALLRAGKENGNAAPPQECTAFFASPQATAGGGPLLGQTWDMDPQAERFVIALRLAVDGAPACVLLSHAGGVALAGLNAAGLGVTINNLQPTDATVGVPWPFLVRKLLACSDFDNGFLALTQGPFSSGHNYLLSDAEGRAVDVETSGEECEVRSIETPTYAHANHYTCESLKPLAAPLKPEATTCRREARLAELLAAHPGPLDVPALQQCLGDPQVEAAAAETQTEDEGQGVTCASAILDLRERVAHLRQGRPSQGALRPVPLSSRP